VREPGDGPVAVHREDAGEVSGEGAGTASPAEDVGLTEDATADGDAARPDAVAALSAAVADLADQVRAHHARAEAREKVIDHLHAEVERLRVGEQGLLLRPVVTDLQTLRGDLLRQARTLPDGVGSTQVAALLESFALSVEHALERCGSTPVHPEPGEPFSAREHRAVKVVEAASPDEDSTIAEVITDGYFDAAANRVTAPARVHVRKWSGGTESTTDQGESGEVG
jgi:molecular chaperone GrpE (heat shock protein)